MQSTTPSGPQKSPETVGTNEQGAVVDLEGKDIVEIAPVEDVIPAFETSGAPGTGPFNSSMALSFGSVN